MTDYYDDGDHGAGCCCGSCGTYETEVTAYEAPTYSEPAYTPAYAEPVYTQSLYEEPTYDELAYAPEPGGVEYPSGGAIDPLAAPTSYETVEIGGYDLDGGMTIIEPDGTTIDPNAGSTQVDDVGGYDLNGGAVVIEPDGSTHGLYGGPASIDPNATYETIGGDAPEGIGSTAAMNDALVQLAGAGARASDPAALDRIVDMSSSTAAMNEPWLHIATPRDQDLYDDDLGDRDPYS